MDNIAALKDTNKTNNIKTLSRITAEISRASEYFSLKELQAQTGQPYTNFASVVLKELVDNALDACESNNIIPEINIDILMKNDIYLISISDNGRGIPPHTVSRILDFSIRVSDKSIYRSPTRGAQGNALKTVLGIPFSLGCSMPVIIEAQGTKHTIYTRVDAIGNVRIEHSKEPSQYVEGTKITVPVPSANQKFYPEWWAKAFAIFNPHASIKIRLFDKKSVNDSACSNAKDFQNKTLEFLPTVSFPDEWIKFLPTNPTSPWWYSEEDLARLIFAYVYSKNDITLREFVRQFRGFSGTQKAKEICSKFSEIKYLRDFEEHQPLIGILLETMKKNTNPVHSKILGFCGEEHFKTNFSQLYGIKRFWYKSSFGEIEGIPYVIEVALAETQKEGDIFTGINFSPTFDDPLASIPLSSSEFEAYGIHGFLSHVVPYAQLENSLKPQNNIAMAFHLVCPSLDFLDRAKTHITLHPKIAEDVAKTLWSVCKTIYKERKQREKNAARAERKAMEREKMLKRAQYTVREAVFKVLPEAIEKATGNGKYPVSARTLYYQVRPLIQTYTNKELEYNYFSQKLLVEYQKTYGVINLIYYDPRGILYEPYTRKTLPLGTREVEKYEFPDWVFNKILYVEKKGVWPVLEASQIAERYDMAIIVAEGYATQAARILFERADKQKDYKLFVLHDADPYGYNIARTLREETERMKGYSVDVIDIGLKLEEALEMGLQSETFTREQDIPNGIKENLTPLEKEWFIGKKIHNKSSLSRRIELNAMSGPQLVEYIEKKLEKYGACAKVLPPQDIVITHANNLHHALLEKQLEQRIIEKLNIRALVNRTIDQLPSPNFGNLMEYLSQELSINPPESWRQLVQAQIEEYIKEILNQVDWNSILE
ncbi:ATP-binding region ATPase domain protein [Thermoanaerobacter ethanolicus JW 200]|uniref:ATP-binding protein n=1 Tax=Thermoanaerobacter ethanolicus TaxID=1757 RepID=UPI000202D80F|nr:ATP-binding region ATPase domain protein [Thermoanaerobacter ethanolicus JW 200]